MPAIKKSTVAQLHKKLQPIFNHYIRLRDLGLPCISCGKPWEPLFQAGHFLPATHYLARYSFYNVNGQCQQCNGFKKSNWPGYCNGIIKRYGDEVLHGLLETWGKTYPWKREELEELIEFYKAKVKELENEPVGAVLPDSGA